MSSGKRTALRYETSLVKLKSQILEDVARRQGAKHKWLASKYRIDHHEKFYWAKKLLLLLFQQFLSRFVLRRLHVMQNIQPVRQVRPANRTFLVDSVFQLDTRIVCEPIDQTLYCISLYPEFALMRGMKVTSTNVNWNEYFEPDCYLKWRIFPLWLAGSTSHLGKRSGSNYLQTSQL